MKNDSSHKTLLVTRNPYMSNPIDNGLNQGRKRYFEKNNYLSENIDENDDARKRPYTLQSGTNNTSAIDNQIDDKYSLALKSKEYS